MSFEDCEAIQLIDGPYDGKEINAPLGVLALEFYSPMAGSLDVIRYERMLSDGDRMYHVKKESSNG